MLNQQTHDHAARPETAAMVDTLPNLVNDAEERELFYLGEQFYALLSIYSRLDQETDVDGRNEERDALGEAMETIAEQIEAKPAKSLRTFAARVLVGAWQTGRDSLIDPQAIEPDARWAPLQTLIAETRAIFLNAKTEARAQAAAFAALAQERARAIRGTGFGLADLIEEHRKVMAEWRAGDGLDDEVSGSAFDRAEKALERICGWPALSRQEVALKAEYLAGVLEFTEFDLGNLRAFVDSLRLVPHVDAA
jgi:hypothetical protein